MLQRTHRAANDTPSIITYLTLIITLIIGGASVGLCVYKRPTLEQVIQSITEEDSEATTCFHEKGLPHVVKMYLRMFLRQQTGSNLLWNAACSSFLSQNH